VKGGPICLSFMPFPLYPLSGRRRDAEGVRALDGGQAWAFASQTSAEGSAAIKQVLVCFLQSGFMDDGRQGTITTVDLIRFDFGEACRCMNRFMLPAPAR